MDNIQYFFCEIGFYLISRVFLAWTFLNSHINRSRCTEIMIRKVDLHKYSLDLLMKKRPQINFSRQNISEENSYFIFLLFNGIAYFLWHDFTFGGGDIFGHFFFYIFANFFFNLSTISASAGAIVFTRGFSYSQAILFLNLATNRI